MFIDYVRIHVKAGDGGNGCISFRREKHVPRGGPNGGDGGDGGSIYLIGDPSLTTLLDLKITHFYKAKRGQHGMGSNCSGKTGDDVRIHVPLGTVVTMDDDEVADIIHPGQVFCAAKGGHGGRGNQHFATASRHTPRYAEKGWPGEDRNLILELKIIADVGLVGLPNAGKSTLLSHITHATPKIAPYPFTTIHPNLGVFERPVSGRRIVIADIPGLIEGASRGVGLGDRFLRHITRTRILVHLVSFDLEENDFENLWEQYTLVEAELATYSVQLVRKPRIVVLNKTDLVSEHVCRVAVAEFARRGLEALPISAMNCIGLQSLLDRIEALMDEEERKAAEDEKEAGESGAPGTPDDVSGEEE